jgi:hypothetical protein
MLRRWAANESAIVALARSREKYNNKLPVVQIYIINLSSIAIKYSYANIEVDNGQPVLLTILKRRSQQCPCKFKIIVKLHN